MHLYLLHHLQGLEYEQAMRHVWNCAGFHGRLQGRNGQKELRKLVTNANDASTEHPSIGRLRFSTGKQAKPLADMCVHHFGRQLLTPHFSN